MNTYEMVYILSSSLTEDRTKEIAAKIEALLAEKKAELIKSESWGSKRFAYPIRKILSGNYFIITFRMDPAALNPLSALLKLTEDILRFMIIRQELKTGKKSKKKKTKQQGAGKFHKQYYGPKRPQDQAPAGSVPAETRAVPQNVVPETAPAANPTEVK